METGVPEISATQNTAGLSKSEYLGIIYKLFAALTAAGGIIAGAYIWYMDGQFHKMDETSRLAVQNAFIANSNNAEIKEHRQSRQEHVDSTPAVLVLDKAIDANLARIERLEATDTSIKESLATLNANMDSLKRIAERLESKLL